MQTMLCFAARRTGRRTLLWQLSDGGGECITTLHVGDGIGEEAVLPHAPPEKRIFSVIAREPTLLVAISRSSFLEAYKLVMNARLSRGTAGAKTALSGPAVTSHAGAGSGIDAAILALQQPTGDRRTTADVNAITSCTQYCSFFHHLDEPAVHAELCRSAHLSCFKSNIPIWEQGDAVPENGGAFLVMLRGAASLHIRDPGAIVDVVSPAWPPACHALVLAGEGLGEMALSEAPGSGERPTTVIDRDPKASVAAAFQKESFLNVTVANVERHSDEAATFLASFVEPLRRLDQDTRAQVARLLKRVEAPKHSELLAAGTIPSKVYVLLNGELREGVAREMMGAVNEVASANMPAGQSLSPLKDAKMAARTRLGARSRLYAPSPGVRDPSVADHLLAAAGGSMLASYANTRRSRSLGRPGALVGWLDAFSECAVVQPVWCASKCTLYAADPAEIVDALGEDGAARVREALAPRKAASGTRSGAARATTRHVPGAISSMRAKLPISQQHLLPEQPSRPLPGDQLNLGSLIASAGASLRGMDPVKRRVQVLKLDAIPAPPPLLHDTGDSMAEAHQALASSPSPKPTLPTMPALPRPNRNRDGFALPTPFTPSEFGLMPAVSETPSGRVSGPKTPAPPAFDRLPDHSLVKHGRPRETLVILTDVSGTVDIARELPQPQPPSFELTGSRIV